MNNICIFPYIHCLTVDYQCLKQALLHRYIHTTQLNLLQDTILFPIMFQNLPAYFNTSRITKCNVNFEWIRKSPYELAEFLRSIPCLRALSISVDVLKYLYLHQWSNIIHLRIENDFVNGFQLSSIDDIDALCRSFTHIERLDIHSTSITVLPQLLKRMTKTLVDIIIRQPQIISKEQLITREWIERYTELQHFHYTCDTMNSVILWF